MKRFIVGICIGLAVATGIAADNNVELKQTTEIIGLLKSHYVDAGRLDQKRLTDATVSGLLKALGTGAQLLSAAEAKAKPVAAIQSRTPAGQRLARAEVIDPKIGYLRLADVEPAAVAELDAELAKFATARVTGYVLDLRFADGTNFAAAAALAGRFLREGRELFSIQSADKPPVPFRCDARADAKLAEAPLMILVNHNTRGAAEVLAGALRGQDRGIVIGTTTAGGALAWQDLPLSDGRVLRVATAKVALPKGSIFPGGVTPDVPVKIDLKIERDVVLNSTNTTLTASLTAEQTHKMMTEADLVKYHRGEAFDLPGSKSATNKTTSANGEKSRDAAVRDVVLQRAVDILKGIRVLLSWR
jgi:C-terminal processing protease CtpA/Prc